jgi:hypothetical protein
MLRIFSPWKIRRLQLGLNPRSWVPEMYAILDNLLRELWSWAFNSLKVRLHNCRHLTWQYKLNHVLFHCILVTPTLEMSRESSSFHGLAWNYECFKVHTTDAKWRITAFCEWRVLLLYLNYSFVWHCTAGHSHRSICHRFLYAIKLLHLYNEVHIS